MHLEEGTDVKNVLKALESPPLESHVSVVAAEQLDVADAFYQGYFRRSRMLCYLDHSDNISTFNMRLFTARRTARVSVVNLPVDRSENGALVPSLALFVMVVTPMIALLTSGDLLDEGLSEEALR